MDPHRLASLINDIHRHEAEYLKQAVDGVQRMLEGGGPALVLGEAPDREFVQEIIQELARRGVKARFKNKQFQLVGEENE